MSVSSPRIKIPNIREITGEPKPTEEEYSERDIRSDIRIAAETIKRLSDINDKLKTKNQGLINRCKDRLSHSKKATERYGTKVQAIAQKQENGKEIVGETPSSIENIRNRLKDLTKENDRLTRTEKKLQRILRKSQGPFKKIEIEREVSSSDELPIVRQRLRSLNLKDIQSAKGPIQTGEPDSATSECESDDELRQAQTRIKKNWNLDAGHKFPNATVKIESDDGDDDASFHRRLGLSPTVFD